MPKLTLSLNGLILKEFELGKASISVGRRSDCDIQLDDPAVSGIHARLSLSPDPYLDGVLAVEISDAHSTNGLFVNGERVTRRRLSAGDVIGIGQHELRFDDAEGNGFEQTAIFLVDES